MSGLPPTPSEPPKVTESYNTQRRIPKKIVIIVLGVLVILLLGVVIFQTLQKNRAILPIGSDQANATPPAPGVIAKVGEELIYQRELDIELSAYPPSLPLEQRKALLIQKIATDSAILQIAKKDGIISNLDTDIFNSPDLDYLKRLKTVSDIQNEVEGKAGKISGAIVSIWFYNFGVNAPIGYDKGKELALQKITKLHTDVKSGKMTIEQAAESIRSDSSMSQLDPGSYKQNARQLFDTSIENLITHNSELDKQLRSLPVAGVSDIFLSTEPFFDKPGFYQFGQITNKVSNSKFGSFDEWFAKGQKNYAITLY